MNRFLINRLLAVSVAFLSLAGVGIPAFATNPLPFQGRADVVVTNANPLTAYGVGQATYLGRFTRTETLIVNPLDGTFTGSLIFTAANGDRLCAGMTGRFTSPLGDRAEGTYTFRGGTGLFRNASGEAEFKVAPDGQGFDVTFDGTIQF